MSMALHKSFGLDIKDAENIAWLIDGIHNASLVHDDIEDKSEYRRGAVVSHKVYGLSQSLNTGTYYLIHMIEMVYKLFENKSLEVVTNIQKTLLNTVKELHKGQCIDIYFGDYGICPSMGEYMKMIHYKTAALFRCIAEISNCIIDVKHLPAIYETIGIFFQVRDDYCNIVDPMYWKSKGFYEDADEGKYSYPIIKFMESAHDKKEWVRTILLQKQVSRKDKLTIYEMLIPTLQHCKNDILQLRELIPDHYFNKELLKVPDVIEDMIIVNEILSEL